MLESRQRVGVYERKFLLFERSLQVFKTLSSGVSTNEEGEPIYRQAPP